MYWGSVNSQCDPNDIISDTERCQILHSSRHLGSQGQCLKKR